MVVYEDAAMTARKEKKEMEMTRATEMEMTRATEMEMTMVTEMEMTRATEMEMERATDIEMEMEKRTNTSWGLGVVAKDALGQWWLVLVR